MREPKIRRITRARDKRADMLIHEAINASDLPPIHADTHAMTGEDPILPSTIGAETPEGAQAKANDVKNFVIDNYQPVLVFTSDERPEVPTGTMGFDMTLGIPVWFNGTEWVDSSGINV
jgi:hypothetical protein